MKPTILSDITTLYFPQMKVPTNETKSQLVQQTQLMKKHSSETFECLSCAVSRFERLALFPLSIRLYLLLRVQYIHPPARRSAMKEVMRSLLLLPASTAAWIFQLAASAASTVAGSRTCCVFQPWAGGSCGCCSCRDKWWLRLLLEPLRLMVGSECGHCCSWRLVRLRLPVLQLRQLPFAAELRLWFHL